MTVSEQVEAARRRLGRIGVWQLDVITANTTPADVERREVRRIEELGYGSLWIGEAPGGKEAFAHLTMLLAATERMVIAPGIANIRSREPAVMQAGTVTLAEAYPDRLLFGLGGTGKAQVMRDYLEAMAEAARSPIGPFAADPGVDVFERMSRYLSGDFPLAPTPPPGVTTVLAALGPRMLELARDHAAGAHPFSMPVAHTALARRTLGPDRLLVPEVAVILDVDRSRAQDLARRYIATASRIPRSPYTANLRRLGFGDEKLFGSRQDTVVDALVAWGDEETILRRVREHLDAGADHGLVHPLAADLPAAVDQLERLAPALLELGGRPAAVS